MYHKAETHASMYEGPRVCVCVSEFVVLLSVRMFNMKISRRSGRVRKRPLFIYRRTARSSTAFDRFENTTGHLHMSSRTLCSPGHVSPLATVTHTNPVATNM